MFTRGGMDNLIQPPSVFMNKVCIAIPTRDGNIYFELALRLVQWTNQRDIPVELIFQPFSAPVDHARNDIVRRFMATKCTHLLMIDDDIVPPFEALERLVKHNKDIVAAICPLIGPNKKGEMITTWNAFYKTKNGYAPWGSCPGLQKVAAVGTGCIMIKRGVFDYCCRFTTEYDKNTGIKTKGEDISFCDQVAEHGFKIFADFKLECKHIKACNLLELQPLYED